MPDVEVLDKTEIWIEAIALDNADLRALAAAAAAALTLRPDLVFVTDVRGNHVVLDVLQPRISLEHTVAKADALLAALDAVPGVTVHDGAAVHSRGVFGVIGVPAPQAEQVLESARKAEQAVKGYVESRVAVVSTGPEVVGGQIADTNLQTITQVLSAAGYEPSSGGSVNDEEGKILGRVLRLASDGFGIIITTGGVGAEDKDCTIEALTQADPDLATAVLATYQVGHGRHVKPHVRVAVGQVGWSRLVALPGPTREVTAAMPVVVAGLAAGWEPRRFAEEIATVLRDCLRQPPTT